MVTRCLEALDRLEEVTQQIYKKSSVQEKIKKVESKLNQQSKTRQSIKNEMSKLSNTRIMKVKGNKSNHLINCRNIPSIKETAAKRGLPKGQGKNVFKSIRKGQVNHQSTRLSISKPPNKKNPHKAVIDRLESSSLYIAEDTIPEPLCWEEQVNSKQVKILMQKQHPIISHDINKSDSHPVVFHDKKWIEEMLLKRPAQFHIASSCCLPRFQAKEGKTKINKCQSTSGKRTNTENMKSKSRMNDKLELKGIPAGLTGSRQIIVGENVMSSTISHSMISASRKAYTLSIMNNHQDNGHNNDNCKYHVVSERLDTTNKPRDISTTSLVNPSDDGIIDSSKQYVDISVCVPNAEYSEALADDCRSLISCGTDKSKISDIDHEALYTSELQCFTERSDPNIIFDSERADEGQGFRDEVKVQNTKWKTLNSSNSSSDLLTCKSEPYSNSQRSSSRLLYTPSSRPLFLSDQIVEFPRSVSPVKALMELRQNFCENIRKETKQLEFDLQELYLKKQLHER